MLRIPLPEYADGPLNLPVEILRITPANAPSRKAQGPNAPSLAERREQGTEGTTGRARYGTHKTNKTHGTSCAPQAQRLRKKRGQSVSDGMSRASLGVFAVNPSGSASPSGDFGCGSAPTPPISWVNFSFLLLM